MIEKIKKQVEKNPNKIFYKNNNNFITYLELWKQASFYSKYLKKQGDSPVIIYGNKEAFVVISMVACLLANRSYVPVAMFTPLDRLKKIIKLTKSTLIISKQNLIIDNIHCCTLEKLHQFDKENIKNVFNNQIAYIIFTSGSTGEPKGVPISYSNLNNFVNWISNLKALKYLNNINVLNQASFSFDLSVADFYYSLCNGHTLISFNDINDYNNIFDVIKREKINLVVITPTFMKMLLINKEFNEINFPDFKYVYFCGEQLEVRLVKSLFERFSNVKVINAYGPTEATSAVSAIDITKEMLNNNLLPVGEIKNFATNIEILNDEIVLSGDSVFNGYLGLNSSAHYTINGINFYKTGDIGFIENAMLFCKGRKDEQIKYKGYRIELNDIKNNIDNIVNVKDSIVIAKNNSGIVKGLKAYIVCDGNFDRDYIRCELAKKLPFYMIPNSIIEIDKIPLTKNGKVDKEALKKYE